MKGPFLFVLHIGGVGQTARGADGRCLARSGDAAADPVFVGVCGNGRFAKSGSLRLPIFG